MVTVLHDQVEAFVRFGATVVPKAVAQPDLMTLRKGAKLLIDRFYDSASESPDYWSYFDDVHGRILYRIHNLEKQAWIDRELLSGKWLTMMAETFIQVPAVATAYALVLKEPLRGAEIPWHRDRVDVVPGRICNLSLCLDDWAPGCGQLEWLPGSHLLPDATDVAAVRAESRTESVRVEAGDVMVHDVRLIHGSAHNTSTLWRRNIVIEYSPA